MSFFWRLPNYLYTLPSKRASLTPFSAYYAGAPKLLSFVIRAFHSEQRLTSSFERHELTATSLTTVPDAIKNNEAVQTQDFLLTAANMVFFRQGNPVFADQKVRQALVQAVDTPALVKGLGYLTHRVREPLLQGQLGYNATLVQPGYDLAAANAQLDAAGWARGPGGFRYKDNQPLKFILYAQQTLENEYVTKST